MGPTFVLVPKMEGGREMKEMNIGRKEEGKSRERREKRKRMKKKEETVRGEGEEVEFREMEKR